MAKKIIWSRKAENSFFKIASYIEFKFGLQASDFFIQKVYLALKLISNYPNLGKQLNETSVVRGLIIEGKTTVYCSNSEEGIRLLNFFDHRLNPQKKLG